MSGEGGGALRFAWVPHRAEHERALAASGAAEALPMRLLPHLPLLLAMWILTEVILLLASGPVSWTAFLLPVGRGALFLLGIGIATGPRRRPLTWEVAEDAVRVGGRRRPLTIPWEGVDRVEETPEFLLLRTAGLTCWLPTRAVGERGPELRAALRERLGARAEVLP